MANRLAVRRSGAGYRSDATISSAGDVDLAAIRAAAKSAAESQKKLLTASNTQEQEAWLLDKKAALVAQMKKDRELEMSKVRCLLDACLVFHEQAVSLHFCS